MALPDTIHATATPRAAGPCALVRVSGPRADFICRALTGLELSPRGAGPVEVRLRQGLVPAFAMRLPAPGSYSGDDTLELLVPSSPVLLDVLETRLCDLGSRRALAGEFTRRALAAGHLDVSRAAAVGALVASETEATRTRALAALAGDAGREARALAGRLRETLALLDAAFDFSEDELELPDIGRLRASAALHARELADAGQGARGTAGPLTVALFGAPNAGKSSLFNLLLGHRRSVVSPLAGTTRDTVEAQADFGGMRARLVDLSGVGDADADRGRYAAAARRGALAADLVLLLCAPGQQEGLAREFAQLCAQDRDLAGRAVWVWTMSDLRPAAPDNPAGLEQLACSALTGAGLHELRGLVELRLALRDAGGLLPLAEARAQAAGLLAPALDGEVPPEALASALRAALRALDRALDESTPGDVLDLIFSRFCIGK